MTKRKHRPVKRDSKNHELMSSGGFIADKCCSSVNRNCHDSSSPSLSKEIMRKRTLQLHRLSYNITNRGRHSRGWHSRKKGVTLSGNANESFNKNTEATDNRKCVIVDLTVENKQNARCRTKGVPNSFKGVIETKQNERHDNKDVDVSQSKKVAKKSSSGRVVQTESLDISLSSVSDEFIVLDSSSDEFDSVILPTNSTNDEEFDLVVLPTTSTNEDKGNSDAVSGSHSVDSAEHNQMHICRQYDNHTVLMMKPHCQVSIKGKVSMKCLRGSVSLLGHQMFANHKKYSVFCPNSSSYLSLQSVDDDGKSKNHCKLEMELQTYLTDYPVVVEFRPLYCPVTSFITRNEKFRNLFQDFSISSLTASSSETVIVPEMVLSAAEDWLSDARSGLNATIAVCGGLNTGKSTVGRYLINCALNVVPLVAFLECDIGQTEFTVPGCVSLTLVSEPVLGPPFTHQRTTVSSVFVGRISPASCSKFYVQCLKHVFSAYLRLPSKPPLIINTMGWMKDVGLSLLVDTLRLTTPGHVIQLCNDKLHHIRHLPMMTPEFLSSMSGVLFNQAGDTAVQYKWIRVSSAVNSRSKGDNSYNAPTRREISVLAYFGQMTTTSTETALSVRAVTPYRVQWTDVAIHVCHDTVANSQILYAVNGSMVALCVANPTQIVDSGVPNTPKFLQRDSVCECLGFGIVRSISAIEHALFIATPLAPSALQKVNCLQLGAIGLPTCLLTSDEPAACSLPYVDYIQKVPVIHSRKFNEHQSPKNSVRDDFI